MMADGEQIGSPDGKETLGWNELGFVPWQSFRSMAPPILSLEVSRLGELIEASRQIEFRNALVKTRYELDLFVDALKRCEGGPTTIDTAHLQSAILNLPLDYPGIDPKTVRTLAYILDRLQYVHDRIRFVYQ